MYPLLLYPLCLWQILVIALLSKAIGYLPLLLVDPDIFDHLGQLFSVQSAASDAAVLELKLTYVFRKASIINLLVSMINFINKALSILPNRRRHFLLNLLSLDLLSLYTPLTFDHLSFDTAFPFDLTLGHLFLNPLLLLDPLCIIVALYLLLHLHGLYIGIQTAHSPGSMLSEVLNSHVELVTVLNLNAAIFDHQLVADEEVCALFF